jgi:hypothetical protein
MAQAVSRRPLTAKFWVRSQSNPIEICGENKWHCGRVLLQLHLFSPVSTTPPILHTNLRLHVVLIRRTNGRSLESFEKAMLFRKSRSAGQITTFTCSRLTHLHYTCMQMTPICTQVTLTYTHTHTHPQHATSITYLQYAFCVYKTDFTSVLQQINRRTDTLLPDQLFTMPQQYGSCTPSIVDARYSTVLPSASLAHNTRMLNKTRTSCTPLIVVAASWIASVVAALWIGWITVQELRINGGAILKVQFPTYIYTLDTLRRNILKLYVFSEHKTSVIFKL